jgi:hypothetical protein
MTDEREWRALSGIVAALEALRPSFPADDEFEDALANAIRSGVPVRARPFDDSHPDYDCLLARPTSAFKPIEAYMGPDTGIKIAADFISLKSGTMAGTYLRAEADVRALRKWLRENLLPASSLEGDNENPAGRSLDAHGKKPAPGGARARIEGLPC